LLSALGSAAALLRVVRLRGAGASAASAELDSTVPLGPSAVADDDADDERRLRVLGAAGASATAASVVGAVAVLGAVDDVDVRRPRRAGAAAAVSSDDVPADAVTGSSIAASAGTAERVVERVRRPRAGDGSASATTDAAGASAVRVSGAGDSGRR
jgi:hypothetical protein